MILTMQNYMYEGDNNSSRLFMRQMTQVSGSKTVDLLQFIDGEGEVMQGSFTGDLTLQIMSPDESAGYRSFATMTMKATANWQKGKREGWYVTNVQSLYMDGVYGGDPFDKNAFSVRKGSNGEAILQGYKVDPDDMIINVIFEGYGIPYVEQETGPDIFPVG